MEELLSRGVEWHCRRGLRECDCSYCREKRHATSFIGNGPAMFTIGRQGFNPSWRQDYPDEYWRDAAKRGREIARRELWERLDSLKRSL